MNDPEPLTLSCPNCEQDIVIRLARPAPMPCGRIHADDVYDSLVNARSDAGECGHTRILILTANPEDPVAVECQLRKGHPGPHVEDELAWGEYQ